MRAFFFILFLCPLVFFAQNQQPQPANGSTDCPTFGKKNVPSKAGIFQYMRTHKPQRTPTTTEQPVYRSSALPNLQEAAEAREASLKQQEKNEKALARASRQRKNRPVTPEPKGAVTTPDLAEVTPVKEPPVPEAKPSKEPVATAQKDTNDDAVSEEKEETESVEDAANTAKEKRDKKIKKAAFKSKMQHLFKRTNKPTSRKHVEKCPSF